MCFERQEFEPLCDPRSQEMMCFELCDFKPRMWLMQFEHSWSRHCSKLAKSNVVLPMAQGVTKRL